MFKLRLISIIIICYSTVIAQNGVSTPVLNSLSYFFNTNDTALHLHINKTIFIAGEDMWYTAYAFDRTKSKISNKKINVIVVLYDDKGKEVSKQMLLIEKGLAKGSILLPPSLKDNTYYLKAFTIGMNRLNEDESFIQPIQIINEGTQLGVNNVKIELKYDIQLQPEGGHYVEAVKNTVGIKILDQKGKGVQSDNITLINSNNDIIISNINTNTLGMGKFEYIPQPNLDYKLKIEIDDVIKYKIIPKAEATGVVLTTDLNYNSGNLNVILATNTKTLNNLTKQSFKLLLHKNGDSKSFNVTFEQEFPQIKFQIPNKELFNGVNTITIFNHDNKPILERLIFNHKNVIAPSISISKINKELDSFTYALSNKTGNASIKSNISISVLPENTIGNLYRSDIYTNIYLKPFLKGNIEKGSYYFKNGITPQKKYELDLLLLNQGWSKYAWDDIFNEIVTTHNEEEDGITISGYVTHKNKKSQGKQVLLYSKDNKTIDIAELENNKNFQFTNLKIYSNSKFKLSLIDNKGKPIPQANFFYNISPIESNKKSTHFIDYKNPFKNTNFLVEKAFDDINDFEQLDEVVVNATALKHQKYQKNLKSKFGIKIDSSYHGRTLADYLKQKEGLGESQIGPGYYFRFGDGGKAYMIVNGLETDYISFPMDYIEELYFSENYAIPRYFPELGKYLKRSPYYIFTNGKERELPKHLRSAKEFTLVNGFAKPKEFYTPEYNSYESDAYQDYGVVSWYPELLTNEKGYISFKLNNPSQTNLKFFIEGFTENGDPFANVIVVQYK